MCSWIYAVGRNVDKLQKKMDDEGKGRERGSGC